MNEKLSKEEKNILGVMAGFVECFGIERNYTYLSTPIVTGLRLYKTLEKYKVREKGELSKDIIFNEVIVPNLEDAEKVAENLKRKNRKIINPATLDVMKEILHMDPKWSQKTFMELWKMTLMRYCNQIIFNKSWEYSDGAIQEWLMGLEKNKVYGMEPSVDLSGEVITATDFCKGVSASIKYLKKRNFNASKLESFLDKAKSYYPNRKY